MRISWKYVKLLLLGTIICGAIIFCGCVEEGYDTLTPELAQKREDAQICYGQVSALIKYVEAMQVSEKNVELLGRLQSLSEAFQSMAVDGAKDVSLDAAIQDLESIKDELAIDSLYLYGNNAEEQAKRDMQNVTAYELMRLRRNFAGAEASLSGISNNRTAIEFLSRDNNLEAFKNRTTISYQGHEYTAYAVIGGIILAKDESGNIIEIVRTSEYDAILKAAGVSKYNLEPSYEFRDGAMYMTSAPGAVTTIKGDYDQLHITKSVNNFTYIKGNINALHMNGSGTTVVDGNVKTAYLHSGETIFAKAPQSVTASPGATYKVTQGLDLPKILQADKTPVEETTGINSTAVNVKIGPVDNQGVVTEITQCPLGDACPGEGCDFQGDYPQFHPQIEEE